MAHGGEVFVLDMGEPVKIRDLARRMILLMGLTIRDDDNPNGDIEIHYTGLRPAEKLYEELLIGENATGTQHPRIMRAKEDYLNSSELNSLLDELQEAVSGPDCRAVRDVLIRAVKEYDPANDVEDLLFRGRTTTSTGNPKVVSLRTGERWGNSAKPPSS
jgi:FlaA1/EpsC-like NDP-sugar epimerase